MLPTRWDVISYSVVVSILNKCQVPNDLSRLKIATSVINTIHNRRETAFANHLSRIYRRRHKIWKLKWKQILKFLGAQHLARAADSRQANMIYAADTEKGSVNRRMATIPNGGQMVFRLKAPVFVLSLSQSFVSARDDGIVTWIAIAAPAVDECIAACAKWVEL